MIKTFIRIHLARFTSEDEEGQTLVEYGLLLGLLAIVMLMSLFYFGPILSQVFQNVGTTLNEV